MLDDVVDYTSVSDNEAYMMTQRTSSTSNINFYEYAVTEIVQAKNRVNLKPSNPIR